MAIDNKESQVDLEDDVVNQQSDDSLEYKADNANSKENTSDDSKHDEEAGTQNNMSDEESEEESSKGKADKKKKKSFKKKDKKDEQIEELNDKYQRLFAEFQNFRSRSEKEKTSMFEIGAKSIIEKILPVVDNFERGMASLSDEDLASAVGQGMNLIYKQLQKTLEDMGVEAIEAKGKEFDPELHNAVMHEDNDELGENIVSEELQKGYKYKGSVIRHSMVKVAN
jgi:molecular chaperone GrpE